MHFFSVVGTFLEISLAMARSGAEISQIGIKNVILIINRGTFGMGEAQGRI